MKIFASDFDGTIYFPMDEPPVHKDAQAAIKKFQSEGNLFGLSTGRPMYSAKECSDEYIDYDFYICDSGSYIQDRNGHILVDKPIPTELVHELMENDEEHKKFIHIDQHFFYYKEATEPWATEDMIKHDIEGIEKHKVHNITYICKDLREAELMAIAIRTKYDGILTAFNNGALVDIVAYGCSKGDGLKLIMDYYKGEKSAGIGDGHNDLPLLKAANMSFTFPYAPQIVQDEADHVVPNIETAIKLFEQE